MEKYLKSECHPSSSSSSLQWYSSAYCFSVLSLITLLWKRGYGISTNIHTPSEKQHWHTLPHFLKPSLATCFPIGMVYLCLELHLSYITCVPACMCANVQGAGEQYTYRLEGAKKWKFKPIFQLLFQAPNLKMHPSEMRWSSSPFLKNEQNYEKSAVLTDKGINRSEAQNVLEGSLSFDMAGFWLSRSSSARLGRAGGGVCHSVTNPLATGSHKHVFKLFVQSAGKEHVVLFGTRPI